MIFEYFAWSLMCYPSLLLRRSLWWAVVFPVMAAAYIAWPFVFAAHPRWLEYSCLISIASLIMIVMAVEVFGCQRSGLTELDLLALPSGEHPVDHAAVEVNRRCCRGGSRRSRLCAADTARKNAVRFVDQPKTSLT